MRMSIPSIPQPFPTHYKKTSTRIIAALVLIAVTLGAIVYAATQLNFNNNGTINVGVNLSMTQPTDATPNCATATGYTESPSTVQWGTRAPGDTPVKHFCLRNTGSQSKVLTVSFGSPSTLSAEEGTVTLRSGSIDLNGFSIAPGTSILVDYTWTVGTPATPPLTADWTVNIA